MIISNTHLSDIRTDNAQWNETKQLLKFVFSSLSPIGLLTASSNPLTCKSRSALCQAKGRLAPPVASQVPFGVIFSLIWGGKMVCTISAVAEDGTACSTEKGVNSKRMQDSFGILYQV